MKFYGFRVSHTHKPAKVIVETAIGLSWARKMAAGAITTGLATSATISGYDGATWHDIPPVIDSLNAQAIGDNPNAETV